MFSNDTKDVNYFLLDYCDKNPENVYFAQGLLIIHVTQHTFHTKAGYILYIPLLWFMIVISVG